MSDIDVTREEDEAFEQLARRLDEALQDNARLVAENERQKSEWQAEAVESVLMIINDHKVMLDKIKHCQYIEALDDIRDDVQAVAESYRRQAQPFTAAREWVKSVEDRAQRPPAIATEAMVEAAENMNASDYDRPALVWQTMLAAMEDDV